MKIPMVLTSHDKLGNAGRKNSFRLEEFAAPTTRSKTPAPRSCLPRRRAANRLRIRKEISLTFRPTLRVGSQPMLAQKAETRENGSPRHRFLPRAGQRIRPRSN
jgi:hypothetical protein